MQAPFRAGIQVKAYQLEPLRKALRMPRVGLFIADDVGLGKTIEAGLIGRELLMRQRVRAGPGRGDRPGRRRPRSTDRAAPSPRSTPNQLI